MPNLFPVGYETEIIAGEETVSGRPIGYRNGIAFDDKTGDFLRDGKNRLLDSNGIESWKSWIVNTTMTERYKHLAYSSDIGIEYDRVFNAKSREEAESILTRQIVENIMADPYGRCEYVENVEFTWTGSDAVTVSITVQGIDDVTLDVTAYITRQNL